MERGAFRLPTVEFWSRPLQWVGHESTRKSGEPNSDSNIPKRLAQFPHFRFLSEYVHDRRVEDPSSTAPVTLPRDFSVDRNTDPVAIGMYLKHLRKWTTFFSRKSIRMVDADNLKESPWVVMPKVGHCYTLSLMHI